MMDYKYNVFISYSRKDTNVVDKICNVFDDNNISYFIDKQGIGGGLEFPKLLAEAILSSQIFLFIASSNSYESKFTQSEVVFAFNRKQKNDIIPYIIDNSTFPPELEFTFSAINWRRRSTHPIETVLLNDILERLNRQPTALLVPTNQYKRVVTYAAAVMVILVAVVFSISKCKDNAKSGEDIEKEEPVVSETLKPTSVTDSICRNDALGEFTYTGSIDENLLPHGKGEAKFGNGDTYQGEFVHGRFEGHATYRFAIGDKFVGIFKNNDMFQGTYTRGNGDYFRGTFNKGEASEGIWYNSKGKEL